MYRVRESCTGDIELSQAATVRASELEATGMQVVCAQSLATGRLPELAHDQLIAQRQLMSHCSASTILLTLRK